MKKQLERLIQLALKRLLDQQELVAMPAFVHIEASKSKQYGDLTTNIALIVAKTTHHTPKAIAERIVAAMDVSPVIERITVTAPGFINFFLAPLAYQLLLNDILRDKERYGYCKLGRAKRVLIELLAISPHSQSEPITLQESHLRQAVFGKALANLLNAVGFRVETECFIDDAVFNVEQLEWVQEDLQSLDIAVDYWTRASSLVESRSVANVIERLDAKGAMAHKDGSYWFEATRYGDTRDRVLQSAQGTYTHLAYDLAYHLSKFERGFDLAIDMFDFQPKDYAAGIQAGMQAFGYDPEQLMSLHLEAVHVPQYAEEGRLVPRLLAHLPVDIVKCELLMRRTCHTVSLSDMESILDKSQQQSCCYVQYAIVRIDHVFDTQRERHLPFNPELGLENLACLQLDEERVLLNAVSVYADTLLHAALHYEPHLLVYYLRNLAADLHKYYSSDCVFLTNDELLRSARLVLLQAVRQVLVNGCHLLGLHVLTSM